MSLAISRLYVRIFRPLSLRIAVMETIAGLVTIAQLSGYAINIAQTIFETYQGIRFRSAHLRHQLSQIERLQPVLEDLESVEADARKVGARFSATSHLEDTLRALVVTITKIRDILGTALQKQGKKFLLQVFYAYYYKGVETHLKKLFKHLEADKTSLLLSLHANQLLAVDGGPSSGEQPYFLMSP